MLISEYLCVAFSFAETYKNLIIIFNIQFCHFWINKNGHKYILLIWLERIVKH